jgi:hypothetical protein
MAYHVALMRHGEALSEWAAGARRSNAFEGFGGVFNRGRRVAAHIWAPAGAPARARASPGRPQAKGAGPNSPPCEPAARACACALLILDSRPPKPQAAAPRRALHLHFQQCRHAERGGAHVRPGKGGAKRRPARRQGAARVGAWRAFTGAAGVLSPDINDPLLGCLPCCICCLSLVGLGYPHLG